MVEEVNSCMIYLIYHKNLGKCYNVSPAITTIKEKQCIVQSPYLCLVATVTFTIDIEFSSVIIW
jgi:hypothetical protein